MNFEIGDTVFYIAEDKEIYRGCIARISKKEDAATAENNYKGKILFLSEEPYDSYGTTFSHAICIKKYGKGYCGKQSFREGELNLLKTLLTERFYELKY